MKKYLEWLYRITAQNIEVVFSVLMYSIRMYGASVSLINQTNPTTYL